MACLSVLEVVSPEWSDLVLAADVPHREADVLVFHRLNVEPWLFESLKESILWIICDEMMMIVSIS